MIPYGIVYGHTWTFGKSVHMAHTVPWYHGTYHWYTYTNFGTRVPMGIAILEYHTPCTVPYPGTRALRTYVLYQWYIRTYIPWYVRVYSTCVPVPCTNRTMAIPWYVLRVYLVVCTIFTMCTTSTREYQLVPNGTRVPYYHGTMVRTRVLGACISSRF
jgi:hypothetical protein